MTGKIIFLTIHGSLNYDNELNNGNVQLIQLVSPHLEKTHLD